MPITLTHASSGTSARILVGLGFNCYSLRVALDDGPRELLWSHPEFAEGRERPSGSGIPLLFPFGGRIGSARFRDGGVDYELESADGLGNAIHGFVYDRPWRLVEQESDRAVGEFHASRDDPTLADRWPSDFRIRVEYRALAAGLACEVEIENPDDVPLPFGLATHAYFRLPLAAAADAEQCRLTVPVARSWELRDMLPTGRLLDLEPPLDSLPYGMPLAGQQLDHVFTDVRAEGGRVMTTIHDPAAGRTLTQTCDETFRHCVVYTPPHREAVCIEPYMVVPDAFRLEEAGQATGLQRLPPGETFRTRLQITIADDESR